MRKYILIALTAGLLTLLSGCIIVKPATKSVITITRADGLGRQKTFGLRNAYWKESKDGIYIAANGWHPREHETYCFFINEPYYANVFRKVIFDPNINNSQGSVYKVEMWLSGVYIPSENETDYEWNETWKYEGQLNVQVKESLDSRKISFSGIQLYPVNENMPVLLMAGKIVARPDDGHACEHIINSEP